LQRKKEKKIHPHFLEMEIKEHFYLIANPVEPAVIDNPPS